MRISGQLLDKYIADISGTDPLIRRLFQIPKDCNYSVALFPEDKIGTITLDKPKSSVIVALEKVNKIKGIAKDWLDRAVVNNYLRDEKKGIRYLWYEAYSEARKEARTFTYKCDDLVDFRGFGPLKSVMNNDVCIGRIRIDDIRKFHNNVIARKIGLTDRNPNRILDESKLELLADKSEKNMTFMSQKQKPIGDAAIKREYLVKVFNKKDSELKVRIIDGPKEVAPEPIPEPEVNNDHKFICVVQRY